tara:strand:+ start:2949 stop:3653 length:705 start_codon:yes stop_codon:yes gene_type:complete
LKLKKLKKKSLLEYNMNKELILKNTIEFVKKELKNAEGGHDWFHVERVFKNTILISKDEDVNVFVVSLSALLHDIADSKFYNGDESIGPKLALDFLESQGVTKEISTHVVHIINHISFKNSFNNKDLIFNSKELEVVQDADRLDAIGAIGIARCFNYGGFKNRPLYDPEIEPNLNMSKEEYKQSTAPTLNHFYEKLLLLKDKMNTHSGKQIALERHQFMEKYLKQFYSEWNGKL